MAVIVEFPSNDVRTWAEVERGVFAITRKAGASDDVAREVLNGIRPLHDILIAGLDPAFPADESLTQTQHEIIMMALKEFSDRIFIERLHREINHANP